MMVQFILKRRVSVPDFMVISSDNFSQKLKMWTSWWQQRKSEGFTKVIRQYPLEVQAYRDIDSKMVKRESRMTYLTSSRGPLKVVSGFLAPLVLPLASPLSLSSALKLSSRKFTWNNKEHLIRKETQNTDNVTFIRSLPWKWIVWPLHFMQRKLSVNEALHSHL